MNYQLTSALIGLLVAALIVWLVRRDHLHGKYALWWLSVAAAFAILGLSPEIVDVVAVNLGISYPPILVVILGFVFLILKMVTMDIERSKNQVKLHRLAQRMAMYEAELSQFRRKSEAREDESD